MRLMQALVDTGELLGAQACLIVNGKVLVDAAAGQLGGTGETVDWSRFVAAGDLGIPVALAGGLTPANVAEAIRATAATAVDTASGVESAPGRKDPEKMRSFCAAARQALAAVAP